MFCSDEDLSDTLTISTSLFNMIHRLRLNDSKCTEQFAIICQDLIRSSRNSLFPIQHMSSEPGTFYPTDISHQCKQRQLCTCDSGCTYIHMSAALPNSFSEVKFAKNGLCQIYQALYIFEVHP